MRSRYPQSATKGFVSLHMQKKKYIILYGNICQILNSETPEVFAQALKEFMSLEVAVQ